MEQEVVAVSAQLRLEVLGKGWHEAPLRLHDSAIRSATMDGRPARVLLDPTEGYKLLVNNDDDQPRELIVQLDYAKAFSKSPSANTVSFQAPEAPVNRWRIRVPEPGVEVKVHPRIARESSEVPGEAPRERETLFTAFVGATPTVRIDWTPKAEGATGLEALTTVNTTQAVAIDQGIARTQCQLRYEISRAALSELQLRVPSDQRVTGVFDANVRQWEVVEGGGGQTISVQLFQPARGVQNLTVELERFLDASVGQIKLQPIEAVGVARQHGLVAVSSVTELRIETIGQVGLSQVDSAELPTPLQGGDWTLAYQYSAVPFELDLRLDPVTSRIHVDQLVEAYLEPEQLVVELLAILDVRRAGIFDFQVEVPADFEIRAVQGRDVGDATAAAVDSYHRDESQPQLVTIDLARKAKGQVAVLVELFRPLTEGELRDVNSSAVLSLNVPRVVTPAESNTGRLVLHAPESLRVTPGSLVGLRTVSFEDAFSDIGSLRGERFAGLRPILGYVFQNSPATIEFQARLRRPQVSVRQFLVARIESGVTKYSATFFYDVRFSGVRQVRIDIPAEYSDDVRNVTAGVRDAVMVPQPADVVDGFVAWTFGGDTELIGKRQLKLQWERETEELEVGGAFDFQIPQLRPHGADRAWGQIVLAKAESLDIQPLGESRGLRAIDPQHDLMEQVTVNDATRAFEFHDDWDLDVRAKRYALEDVKRTSIERALVRMVVTRSGHTSVQALYRLRSVAQNLAVRLPAEVEFDADPLRINGKAQPLKRGEEELLFIPIHAAEDESFLLELRYTLKGDHRRLDLPVFPSQPPIQSEPAVQKVVLAVYLPEHTVRLGSFGPWTPEEGRLSNASTEEGRLLNWVCEGVALQDNRFRNFPTTGTLHTFSSLRPDPPPAGSLRLVAMPRRILDALTFASVGLFGIVFIRRSLHAKVIVILLITMAVILVGVFAPTLATALLDVRLLLGLGLVLLVWCIATFAMMKSWLSIRPPQLATAAPIGFGAPPGSQSSGTESSASGKEDVVDRAEPSQGDRTEGGEA